MTKVDTVTEATCKQSCEDTAGCTGFAIHPGGACKVYTSPLTTWTASNYVDYTCSRRGAAPEPTDESATESPPEPTEPPCPPLSGTADGKGPHHKKTSTGTYDASAVPAGCPGNEPAPPKP